MRLEAAMSARPELVSGPGRPNTVMLEHLGGRLVTQGGTEGFWCAGLRGPGPGLGVALKVQDGADRAAVPAMLAVLAALGVPGADAPALEPHARPPAVNT